MKFPCRLLFLLILSVIQSGSPVYSQDAAEGRKYALLIGVRNYDRNQLRNLNFTENDVVEMATVLKQAGFKRVVLMTQTEGANSTGALPLSRTIREALTGILEDRRKEDLVLVAFAGHGVQFKDEEEHFFCPMDAVLTDRSTLISFADVYKQLEKCHAGSKLLLVDACRNDPLAGNARDAGGVELASVTRPQLAEPPGGVVAFYSCSAGQRAFEDEKLKHGVFFHHVIRGLQGEAKLKKRDEVTWDSLVAYVKAEVPDSVKDLFGHNVRQIPESKGELRGTSILISHVGNASELPTPTRNNPSSDNSTISDPFKVNTLWHSDNGKRKLKVIERTAGTFSATFQYDGVYDRVVKGTIKDGKVAWLAKDVKWDVGGPGGDNTGTIVADATGYRIDFIWTDIPPKKGTGKFSVNLDNGEQPADSFTTNSIWTSSDGRSKMTVTERNAGTFSARFEYPGSFDRKVKGTVKGGQIVWLAKDVEPISGGQGGNNYGTIVSDKEGDHINFNYQNVAPLTGSGKFTLKKK